MWVSQDSDSLAVARAVHTRMAKQHQPVVLECFGPAAGSVAVRAMAAARLLAQSRGRDLCVMVDEGEQVEVADNAYGTALLTRCVFISKLRFAVRKQLVVLSLERTCTHGF